MQNIGRWDCKLFDSGRLTDRDFEHAIRERVIVDLLGDLPLVQKCHGKNLVGDQFPPFSFYNHMSGAGGGEWEVDGGTFLAYMALMNLDTEVSYTEGQNGSYWHASGNVRLDYSYRTPTDGTGMKRFEEDQIEQWTIWSDAGGREAINFRNRWLFLPTQAVASDIKSIGIFYSDNPTSFGDAFEYASIGRIRLKDSGGNPITINKTSHQVFLVEYTFRLVSA
jgi:hypothetical protein